MGEETLQQRLLALIEKMEFELKMDIMFFRSLLGREKRTDEEEFQFFTLNGRISQLMGDLNRIKYLMADSLLGIDPS